MATRYISYQENLASEKPPPLVELKARSRKFYIPSRDEKFAMGLVGATDFTNVTSFEIARVQGQHFKAGEWGQRRCGSVFVTTYRGRARYGIIARFLGVQDRTYAVVNWLSPPVYPFYPLTLLVKTKLMRAADQPRYRCVIRVNEIEPTGVGVMPDEDGIHFWMMRVKGTDRTDRRHP